MNIDIPIVRREFLVRLVEFTADRQCSLVWMKAVIELTAKAIA